eukprot:m.390209 g.390209  ORF g.390209 m.390209 type:complete len:474 (+) comp20076_c0_seq1:241-1662(+)
MVKPEERTPLISSSVTGSVNDAGTTDDSVVTRRDPAQDESADDDASGPDGPLAPVNGLLVKGLLFIIGMSVFARAETIILQTQFFYDCLGYDRNFYAIASALLFFPGVVIQVLQQRFDLVMDRKFGSWRSGLFRVGLANLVSIACLLVFVFLIDSDHRLGRSRALLYPSLVVLGLATSAMYGTTSQAAAIIRQHQPAFIVGTMCPFFFFLPINIGIGSLCVEETKGQGLGELEPPSTGKEWTTKWTRVWVFFAAGCGLCALGMLAYVWFFNLPRIKQVCKAQDRILHRKDSQSRLASTATPHKEELELPFLRIVRKVAPQLATVGMTTYCSIVVAAQYIQVPSASLTHLPTYLLYEYYISSAIGIVATMKERLCVNENVAAVMAFSRLGFLALIFLYTRPKHDTVMGVKNDYVVLVLNGVFCLSHGYLFSLAYSQTSAKFSNKVVRSRAAQVINTFYYVCMLLAMSTTFLVNL